jgi:hypothetical protein
MGFVMICKVRLTGADDFNSDQHYYAFAFETSKVSISTGFAPKFYFRVISPGS